MEITGKTKLTGLIGSPVAHSISPQMHNAAFQALGLDYVYLAFELGNKNFDDAMAGLKAMDIQGFNITMPYKVRMLDYVDDLTPAASIAGACNTIIVSGGKWTGHTTDGIGFMRSVTDAGHDIIGKKMTILGAGGAATAIITQAALDGVSSIDIFRRSNRTDAYAETERFAKQVSAKTTCPVQVFDIADEKRLKDSLEQSAILVNATNVGMNPVPDATPVNARVLHPDLIVSDIIYNPRRTRLLQEAQQIGCPIFNGMYMLLFQGAASFHCWTGQEMPVELIRSRYFA